MASDSRNLYVSGLSNNMSDSMLRQLFEGFGPIVFAKVCQSYQGGSGYGFVTFCLRESAQTAVHGLNGSLHQGARLQVRRAERGAGKTLGSEASGSSNNAHTNVYVNRWPLRLGEDEFRQAFEKIGEIVSVKLFVEKQREGRVYGFVLFSTRESAQKAVAAMDGVKYDEVALQVSPASNYNKSATEEQVSDERITGTIRAWKDRYGWIAADSNVDHPLASMHRGHIYVNVRDVEGADDLRQGCRVSFMVYANTDGLGASKVHLLAGSGLGGIPDERSPSDCRLSVPSALSAPTLAPQKWWHVLEGDCCPISLTPLEQLEREPFGLLGSNDADNLPLEGIWGERARAALMGTPGQAIHWSDGMFLACSLVANSRFVNPVTRRPLSRGECQSLDDYLDGHQLPDVQVAEAFDLAQAAASDSAIGKGNQRLNELSRDAAALLHIFDEGPVECSQSPRTSASAPVATVSAAPATALGGNGVVYHGEPPAPAVATTTAPRQRRWGRGR
mmetsp:Transcript_101464/g.286227  ORF Transcript_101464/g.286227 Transcript_101464/m.286227 type:complete len:503 (-) Transcript_101464:278-1786(-)